MVDMKWGEGQPLAASLELHERTWGLWGEQALVIVRPAIHWSIAPNFVGALGGSWVGSSAESGELQEEWNGWEQITVKGGNERWKWATRIRQEHRWIESTDAVRHLNRLRIRVSATHPFAWREGRWYASGLVEWWGEQDAEYRMTSCSRTWHALGIGRRFDSGWRVQLTALHQRDARDSGWRVSPVGQVSIHRTWPGR
jgi:hypothetical protein